MAYPKLMMLNALNYTSSHYTRRQVGRRLWSFLSGKQDLTSPLDDQENANVISDLLVYERRQQVKKNINTENVTSAKTKKISTQHKISKSRGKAEKSLVENYHETAQLEVLNLMRAVKSKNFSYFIDEDIANTVVNHIKKDLQPGDIIAEANLGAGILTKALLENTHNKIIGYEPNTEFLVHLRKNFQPYASRLELHSLNLLKFYWYYILNKREPDREDEADKLAQILKPLPARVADDSARVKIVTSVCDIDFFDRLTLSFTFQCCFYKDIYPTFYVCVPQKLYDYFVSASTKMQSRKLRLPFVFYFDLQHLEVIPRSSVYCAGLKRKKNKKNEDEPFHLVKISPRDSACETIPFSEMEMFHYFLRCMNRTKAGESLIFRMEKWIPGCGIDYIKNGFRMFTHPKQLSNDQLLEAYKLFASLPSFKECMFHHHCETWALQYGLKDEESLYLDDEENIDESVEDTEAVAYHTDEETDVPTSRQNKKYWRD